MKYFRTLAALSLMMASVSVMPPAAWAEGSEPLGELVPYNRPACITLRKLKTDKPELFNNCKEPHTIGLAFFKGNEYVGTQVYHVWHKTARPFTHLGDGVMVDWVRDWRDDGSEDGSKSLTLTMEKLDKDELWYAQNASPDRHNAFSLKVFYRNWPSAQIVRYVLAPGERAPVFRVNHDAGMVFVEWSRLDPK